ncbi:hypothetical protein TNCV_4123211 [Trichonephila clavipes]|nr:hypothetical protein TNCV_4123211 [Trichonephila clavipes]
MPVYINIITEFISLINSDERYLSCNKIAQSVTHHGKCRENGSNEQKRCDKQNVQLPIEKCGTRRSRECVCVFRTNRTREAEGRLLWPANYMGKGAFCGPSLVFKRVFLGREEILGQTWRYLKRDLKRREEILESRDQPRSDSESK